MNVIKDSMVVLGGIKHNGLYLVQGKTMCTARDAMPLTPINNIYIWYRRLGCINEIWILELSKQGFLNGYTTISIGVYEHCIYGKKKSLKFGTKRHTIKGIFDYINADLLGPSLVPSLGGSKYYLNIIFDFSRKIGHV